MNIDKIISKTSALFIILLFLPMMSLAHFDYSSDKETTFSRGFDGADSYDLFVDSGLDSNYNNYADIQITDSSNNQVLVNQNSLGTGINKAQVIITNGSGNKAYLSQYGTDNTGLIAQDGSGNRALLIQNGENHEGYIVQTGNDNLALLKQGYRNSSIGIEQIGNNNVALVADFGGSNYNITQSGGSKIAVFSSMGRNISIKQ
ncbi:curlin subunit CsgB [Vibrio sp. F74]|uniref:curlin subunit CsgB n=1 Tax=Vibrio sp. F74 TaxID=700020 RepID=UPI0035F53CD1